MDVVSTRAGGVLTLLSFILIPAVITSLQIVNTRTASPLTTSPGVVIAFSTLYYFIMVLVPAWAGLYTDAVGSHWFLMLYLLYLLWSTLLYALSQVLWSYLVVVLILILSVFMFRPLYKNAHPGFLALFLVA